MISILAFIKSWWSNFITWKKSFKLKEKWAELLLLIGPIILTILLSVESIKEFFGTTGLLIICVIFILIITVAWMQTIRNTNTLEKAIELKDKMEVQKEHVEGVLISLPEELCKIMFDKWEMKIDSRITIYRHTEEHFIPVSRYSINPDFHNINRKSYPKDVGYIKQFWGKDDNNYIKELPDPETNLDNYVKQVQVDCQMFKKDIQKLPMKSRSYFGKTLYNDYNQAFLLVMIESIEAEISNIDIIKNDLDGTFSQFITTLIKANLDPVGGEYHEHIKRIN